MNNRFRDPRQEFFIVSIHMVDDRGDQCDHSFNVRLTEEEFEDLAARSRRQYQRGAFPSGEFRPSTYRTDDDRRRYGQPHFGPSFEDENYRFFFGGQAYDPFEEMRREQQERARREQNKREQQHTTAPKTPKKSPLQQRMRLAELAGVEWPTEIETQKLWKRAQRRCHPDVEGGSHELWIELEQIAIYFNFVKGSTRTASR